jgi:hypothetical protein
MALLLLALSPGAGVKRSKNELSPGMHSVLLGLGDLSRKKETDPMHKILASCVLFVVGTAVLAAPKIPGMLHIVRSKDGDQQVKAQPNDMVEIRIPNPTLPKGVHDLDVTTAGDGVLAGVVNTRDPKLVGSDRISIFVGLKGAARSGTVTYSYKDGEEKEHKGKVIIQVIKKEEDK